MSWDYAVFYAEASDHLIHQCTAHMLDKASGEFNPEKLAIIQEFVDWCVKDNEESINCPRAKDGKSFLQRSEERKAKQKIANLAYLRLSDKTVAETGVIGDQVIVDFAADGSVVGVELLADFEMEQPPKEWEVENERVVKWDEQSAYLLEKLGKTREKPNE